MKKIVFYLYFLFSFQLGIGQINQGSVEYKLVFTNAVHPNFTEFKDIQDNTNPIVFTLNFKDDESYFFINNYLEKDTNRPGTIFSKSFTKNKYYSNKKISIYRVYSNSKEFGEYVSLYEQKADWKLTNESKIINGFKCYKATTSYYNEDGWNDSEYLSVTAWYTPEIPVSYGPNGYLGLPGLILEISNFKSTLIATKLNLSPKMPVKIEKLDNYKVISYNEIIEKTINNLSGLKRDFMLQEIEKRKKNKVKLDSIHQIKNSIETQSKN